MLGWRQQYGTRRDWYTILEWADTLQPRNALTRPPGVLGWYNHNLYQNGWTYRGVILGHPMGADAEMLAFSLGQLTPALGWQLTLEQQRRGVRSVEMENSSATRIEAHRLFELDAQWRDGPRSGARLSLPRNSGTPDAGRKNPSQPNAAPLLEPAMVKGVTSDW